MESEPPKNEVRSGLNMLNEELIIKNVGICLIVLTSQKKWGNGEREDIDHHCKDIEIVFMSGEHVILLNLWNC